MTLLRMVPMKGKARAEGLPQFHEESVIPRVAHVLSSMHAGTFKGSSVIAVAACHILYRVAHDDGGCRGVEGRAKGGGGVGATFERWLQRSS